MIELIVAMVIVAVLAAIGLAKYGTVIEKARSAEAYAVLSEIVAAEQRYRLEYDTFTSSINLLDSFSSDTLSSSNFDYDIKDDDNESGYAQATKKPNRGNADYCICLKTGKHGGCPATCP